MPYSDFNSHKLQKPPTINKSNDNQEKELNKEADEPLSVTPDSLVPSGIVKGGSIPESSSDITSSFQQEKSSRRLAIHDINSSIDPGNKLPGNVCQSVISAVSLLSAASCTSDPTTYAPALSQPDLELWKASMEKELGALESMQVWDKLVLPHRKHALGTTWV